MSIVLNNEGQPVEAGDVGEELVALRLENERLKAQLNDYELAALRKRATCGCGDEFTEHDPGACGNCLAAITAGTDALRDELSAVLADWNSLVMAIGSPTNGGAVGVANALRADAERYRWLLSYVTIDSDGEAFCSLFPLYLDPPSVSAKNDAEQVSAAIDAAMQQHKEQK